MKTLGLVQRLTKIVGIALTISTAAFASNVGSINPDAAIWSGGVSNPTGETPVPAVVYEPSSGYLYLNSAGINGSVDTTTSSLISADDIGMISLTVEGPEPVETLLDGFQFSDLGNQTGGVSWINQYFFGKQAVFGAAAGAEFLDPSLRRNLFRYETGLGMSDFGEVEIGLNFQPSSPGGVIFGGVQIVPEPASCLMMLITTAVVLLLRRRFVVRG
jgi:hypothetical protein